MQKKKCAYVLAASQNIIFAAGNVALELNRYMPDEEFDILIYHRGLERKDVKALNKIKNVVLREFILPQGFEEAILNNMPSGRLKNKHSLLPFAHYEVFNLVDEDQTAIWLDIDTSVQGNIKGLQSFGPVGMAEDKHDYGRFPVQVNFVKPVPGFDMEAPAFCSAVVVASDKLPDPKKIYKWCLDKSIELAEYLITPDQGIINLALQYFKLKVNVFPFEEYIAFSSWPQAHLAKIVHFGTAAKVWNTSDLYQAYPQWQRTHLEYLSLGGSDFDRSTLEQNNIIVGYRYLQQECHELKELLQRQRNYFESGYGRKSYYLFGFLPLLSWRKNMSSLKIKFLGVPLWKEKRKNNKRSFFLLGFIPLLKINRK